MTTTTTRPFATANLLGTSIIQEYLSKCDIPTRWLDARKYVIAEDETNYRGQP